ncbi:hypothetical protein [Sphingobium aromaticiconvertens]|uniref:hypothetical protein n=1 Tax=Sphingobium aromaticiconvertens TaxID=365341 RepID=UPI00301ADDE6
MSTRFWMASAALIGGSVMLGLAVGSFATSQPPRVLPGYAGTINDDVGDSSALANSRPDKGPGEIVCKGCGPTLAERRMAADNPGWDADGMIEGTSDPVVAEYLTQEVKAPPVERPPSDMHRLPANIQRFADGEEGAPPVASPPVPSLTLVPAPPIPAPPT